MENKNDKTIELVKEILFFNKCMSFYYDGKINESKLPKDLQDIKDIVDKIDTKNMQCWKNNLIVEKVYSFSADFALRKTNKDATNKYNRINKVVGYKIKNVGKIDIPYKTMEYSYNVKTKTYDGKKVDKILKPNESCILNKCYFTLLCAREEIGFCLKNGHIITTKSRKKPATFEEYLNDFFFIFEKEEKKNVCDYDINIDIAERKMEGKVLHWCVKEEYKSVFANLEKTIITRKRALKELKSFEKANEIKKEIETKSASFI